MTTRPKQNLVWGWGAQGPSHLPLRGHDTASVPLEREPREWRGNLKVKEFISAGEPTQSPKERTKAKDPSPGPGLMDGKSASTGILQPPTPLPPELQVMHQAAFGPEDTPSMSPGTQSHYRKAFLELKRNKGIFFFLA